jgi:hypothetical protein
MLPKRYKLARSVAVLGGSNINDGSRQSIRNSQGDQPCSDEAQIKLSQLNSRDSLNFRDTLNLRGLLVFKHLSNRIGAKGCTFNPDRGLLGCQMARTALKLNTNRRTKHAKGRTRRRPPAICTRVHWGDLETLVPSGVVKICPLPTPRVCLRIERLQR